MAFIQFIILITGLTLILFHPITSNDCVTFTCGGEVVKKCETFFGCDYLEMKLIEKPKCESGGKEWKCRACTDADACNNNGGTGSGGAAVESTGKCLIGNLKEGYSEQTCPVGQLCYSLGCSYNGGTRYTKGCAASEDICENAAVLCHEFLSGTKVRLPTCQTCYGKDFCNDKGKDEGGDPPKDAVTRPKPKDLETETESDRPHQCHFDDWGDIRTCKPGHTHCITLYCDGEIVAKGCASGPVCSQNMQVHLVGAGLVCLSDKTSKQRCELCQGDLCNGSIGVGRGTMMAMTMIAVMVVMFRSFLGI